MSHTPRRLLARCAKVRYAICGHQHTPAGHEAGRLNAFVIGSDYKTKRLLELDLRTGKGSYREFHGGTGARCRAGTRKAGPADGKPAQRR